MIEIIEMQPADYDEVYALWSSLPGIGLSQADARENITAFLERNPGLSFVARQTGQLCGTVLGGHDGRRGYLHHLAVHPQYRHQHIGTQLAERCLAGMRAAGIQRCHIFVFQDNQDARRFWESIGWFKRGDLVLMSRDL